MHWLCSYYSKKFAVKAINLISRLRVHNPRSFNISSIWKFPLTVKLENTVSFHILESCSLQYLEDLLLLNSALHFYLYVWVN